MSIKTNSKSLKTPKIYTSFRKIHYRRREREIFPLNWQFDFWCFASNKQFASVKIKSAAFFFFGGNLVRNWWSKRQNKTKIKEQNDVKNILNFWSFHSSDCSHGTKTYWTFLQLPVWSRRSQSLQAELNDHRDAEEDQQGRGLKERGGALQLHPHWVVIAHLQHLADRSNRTQSLNTTSAATEQT